jgi:hypothetical protein
MHIVIVGQRNGKAVVQWSRFLGLAFVLSMVVGLGTGLIFYLLAGRWSHTPVLLGIVVGVGITSGGLFAGLKTPPEKLTPLDPQSAEEPK